jgi:hypothetical protein
MRENFAEVVTSDFIRRGVSPKTSAAAALELMAVCYYRADEINDPDLIEHYEDPYAALNRWELLSRREAAAQFDIPFAEAAAMAEAIAYEGHEAYEVGRNWILVEKS